MQHYPASEPAIEARERALARGEPDPTPPLLRAAGPSGDIGLLVPGLSPPLPVVPLLSRFCIPYPTTNVSRPPVGLHRLELTHLYFLRIAQSFSLPRTVSPCPPGHQPSPFSSNWYPLIERLAMGRASDISYVASSLAHLLHGDNITTSVRDTLFRVLNDAYYVGGRCGPTHARCLLCYRSAGRVIPETLAHLLLYYPHSRPVWSAVHLHASRLLEPNFPLLTSGQMLAQYPLRLLFGFTAMRPSSSNRLQQCRLAPVVAACVHRALLERRQHNRSHPASLRADPRPAVARAHRLLRLNARATFTAAQLQEDRIYTDFSTWLPECPPTQAWVDCWKRLFPAAPAHCLRGLPALALPSFDNSEGDAPPPPPPAGGGA